ncbi:MAG: hypothetical protein JSW29_04640, partial [Candidatus Bathyarchaeota archaeon]
MDFKEFYTEVGRAVSEFTQARPRRIVLVYHDVCMPFKFWMFAFFHSRKEMIHVNMKNYALLFTTGTFHICV